MITKAVVPKVNELTVTDSWCSLGPFRLWATVPKSVAEEGGVDESATVAA